MIGCVRGRHRLVGHARLSFGVMLVDVGHRACLRFVFGYFWPVAAIQSRASIIQISLHGSEVQESGEIEHSVSLLRSLKGKFA